MNDNTPQILNKISKWVLVYLVVVIAPAVIAILVLIVVIQVGRDPMDAEGELILAILGSAVTFIATPFIAFLFGGILLSKARKSEAIAANKPPIIAAMLSWFIIPVVILHFADAKNRFGYGMSPFHHAISIGDVNKMKSYLDKDPSLLSKRDPQTGEFAIFHAASRKRPESVKYLLKKGADPNVSYRKSIEHSFKTPLMEAAQNEDLESCKLLIKHGADVNFMNRGGDTALLRSINMRNDDVAILLLKNGADPNNEKGYSPLQKSVSMQRKYLVKELLARGVNVNIKDQFGNMPIHSAVEKGNYEITHLLVEHGANVNSTDGESRTAIMRAQGEQLKDIIGLLVEHGADINHRDKHGETALIHSAIYNELEKAEILALYGARVDLKNELDQKELDGFIEERQKQIMKILEKSDGLTGKD
jgi:ankyrin repeat protein